MKAAFYTLGCKLNFSETSTISRHFSEEGFEKVEFQEEPDILPKPRIDLARLKKEQLFLIIMLMRLSEKYLSVLHFYIVTGKIAK